MGNPDKSLASQAAPQRVLEAAPMAYGRLKQKHPKYDGERMERFHDLYAGGDEIQKKAEVYCPRLWNENKKRHKERCLITAYLGYFGQIVEQFTSQLFAQPLSMLPAADADDPNTPGEMPDEDFYTAFEADADLAGNSFVDLMKACMTTALVQRTAYVLLDAPSDDGAPLPTSKAEAEAIGSERIYAYEVSPREVIDWKVDKRGGGLEWAIINTTEMERETPEDARELVTETFTIWRMDGEFARWDRFQKVYDPKDPPKDEDLVPRVGGGVSSFRCLPLIRLELSKGLWVGNAIGAPQLEHWRRRSSAIGSQNRSLVAIPVVYRGPEIGAVGGAQPSDTQENPTRGRDPVGEFEKKDHVELGKYSDDRLEFAEPMGHAAALVNKELDELKDEIFRVVQMMAASVRPSAGALGRSAQSKQQDGKATALVLRALGHYVRVFAMKIYSAIAKARGDDVVWAPNGLDNYEVIDREAVIEEALSIALIDIQSEIFKTTYEQQVASKLLTGMGPRTVAEMFQQIAKSVKKKLEVDQLKVDAAKEEILNPTPPTVVAPGAPKVATPKAQPPQGPQPPGKQKAA